jgi:hypothetical protein
MRWSIFEIWMNLRADTARQPFGGQAHGDFAPTHAGLLNGRVRGNFAAAHAWAFGGRVCGDAALPSHTNSGR